MKERDIQDGFLPVCCCCRKVRDEAGTWHEPDTPIATSRYHLQLTHGFCPECIAQLYPELGKLRDTASL